MVSDLYAMSMILGNNTSESEKTHVLRDTSELIYFHTKRLSLASRHGGIPIELDLPLLDTTVRKDKIYEANDFKIVDKR